MTATVDVVDQVLGSSTGFEDVLEATGMTTEELEHLLEAAGAVTCPTCGSWTEEDELFDDLGDPDGHCGDCR